jgi:ribosomal protein S27E
MTQMKRVGPHTRAGAHGRVIMCPECRSKLTVYHFAWPWLSCRSCHQEIDKSQWLIVPEDEYVASEYHLLGIPKGSLLGISFRTKERRPWHYEEDISKRRMAYTVGYVTDVPTMILLTGAGADVIPVLIPKEIMVNALELLSAQEANGRKE